MSKKSGAKGEDARLAQYASNHAVENQDNDFRLDSGPQDVSTIETM
jgi:hypothetical protein